MRCNTEICCGCNVCKEVCPTNAISTRITEKGFYGVEIDTTKCVDCGACIEVCPMRRVAEIDSKPMEVYAVQTKDILKRFQSQSGGAFSILAEKIIEDNGVVYGVMFDEGEAKYTRVESIDELERLKGSKYIQADMGEIIGELREDVYSQRKVLFSGTPCVIYAIREYFKQLEIVNENKLYLVDLICHGVPSPKIFREHLKTLHKSEDIIKNYNFRDKSYGWQEHVCSYDLHHNKYFSRDFVKIFYSHLCLNEACYLCNFCNMDRAGDISLGDYWGIHNVDSSFADNIGTSLVLINSAKGKKLVNSIKDRINFLQTSADACKQHNLYLPTEKPDAYDKFWNTYFQNGFDAAVSEFCNYKNKIENPMCDLGWNLYEKLFMFLKSEGIEKIFLYGIGLTMLQMLEYIKMHNIQIEVVGLLDRKANFLFDKKRESQPIEEAMILNIDAAIVLCTKNVDISTLILKRLEANLNYINKQIIETSRFYYEE